MGKPSAPISAFDDFSPWGRYIPSSGMATLLTVAHTIPVALSPLTKMLRRPVKYGLMTPLDIVIWGIKFRLLPRGNMSEQKLYTAPQLFDRDEFAVMESKLKPNGVFVDVGANAGIYSFWAHRCMKGVGRIIAVEPDIEMRRRIDFNIRTNGISNIEIVSAALSEHEGTAELQVNPLQRGQNTLSLVEACISGASYSSMTVPTTTLFALMQSKGITEIDVLKIDIEGYEPQVLNHFFRNAPSEMWPKVVISEFKDQTVHDILGLLAECGYRQVMVTKLNFIFERDKS